MADPYFLPYYNEQTQLISETTRTGMFRDDVSAAFGRVAAALGGASPYTTVDGATYVVLTADRLLHITRTTAGVCEVTLPSATSCDGRQISFKDAGINASVYNITITPDGSEKIDGAANYVIEHDGGAITIYSDGHNWFVKG
jgi:hypothetical protein